MVTRGIDAGQISAMLAQIRAAAETTRMPQAMTAVQQAAGNGQIGAVSAPAAPGRFADVLSQSIQSVSRQQQAADQLGERFAAGDPNVSLSQTMIAMQKANISFQETVQVRDKLVSAYTTIMNMQV